ncbi:hypothetical protein EDD17DRAFT_393367 [Pisolithus thermaeus]|nr:hypothetical protein EDD17DRAFT_393367 [Pisolithus thermaeus]
MGPLREPSHSVQKTVEGLRGNFIAMSIGYEEQAIIHNCIEFAALTFLLYDHLITFAEEVTYIWARLKHASAILFLVNRYLGCLSTIAQTVISLATISPEVHTVHPLPTSIALRESRSRVHAFHSSHVCALWQK